MLFKWFKCPACKKISSAGEWNEETFKLCTSREARRVYVKLQDVGKRRNWYQCPKCHIPNYAHLIKGILQSDIPKEVQDGEFNGRSDARGTMQDVQGNIQVDAES